MFGWPWPQPAPVVETSNDPQTTGIADAPPGMVERGYSGKVVVMITPVGHGFTKSMFAPDAARALARDLMRRANETEGKK